MKNSVVVRHSSSMWSTDRAFLHVTFYEYSVFRQIMSLFALFWQPLFAFLCNYYHASLDCDQFWWRPIISKLPFIYHKWCKPKVSHFESGPRSWSCDYAMTPDYWENNFSDRLYNPCGRGFNGRPLMFVSGRFIVGWWPTMLITGSRVNVCLGL